MDSFTSLTRKVNIRIYLSVKQGSHVSISIRATRESQYTCHWSLGFRNDSPRNPCHVRTIMFLPCKVLYSAYNGFGLYYHTLQYIYTSVFPHIITRTLGCIAYCVLNTTTINQPHSTLDNIRQVFKCPKMLRST